MEGGRGRDAGIDTMYRNLHATYITILYHFEILVADKVGQV